MYRLIAIDLDGTLLTPQKTITSRTIRALQRASAAGITIVIASGQISSMLRTICKDLPLRGPQIICNGAMIIDILSGKVLHEHLVPADHILPGLAALRDPRFHRIYYTRELVYADRGAPNVRNWYRPPVPAALELDDVEQLYPEPCLKLSAIGSSASIRQKRDELEALFAGQLYVTQSANHLLELLHPQVSKGNALLSILNDMGIAPEEAVAVGDNHNDIGMLRMVGLGIAMGNAHDEVKAVADAVTETNANDGVAVAIERLFFPEKSSR